MEFIDFPPVAEFVDRWGEVRPIPLCSVAGDTEFKARLTQLKERLQLAKNETWKQFHRRDNRFRFLVARCLELNGIDSDCVTLDQVETLLFHRWDAENEEWKPGWLLELNGLKEETDQPTKTDQEDLTLAEIIAAISLSTGNIEEAIRLAHSVRPAAELQKIVHARNELTDPKAKERRGLKKARRRYEQNRDEYKRLMSIPVAELEKRQVNPV